MSSEAVFFHPHYDLINNDIIERKKNAPPPSRAEDQEILAEIARYVENTIITTYGFVAIPIPGENADGIMLPSTSVLASPDWLTASKMLLIVNNASGSLLGIFSRSLCLDQGLSKGSMIPYIERALRAQYAVLILRPNTNSIGEKPNNVPILGSESPEIHALYVWENIVAKAENISYIALLGYGNGASLCKDLLLRQMVRSKEDESEANRIRALITIEASHIVEDDDTVDIKDFVRQVGINLECSRSPRGYELAYRKEKLGSTSVSIGLPPGTTEVLNVAASISLSLNPVFQYLKIAEMGGPVERVFFESFAKECGLNPATSVIHHQPADAEADLQLSATPSKSKSTMAETPKKTFFQRLFGGNKNSPKDQGKEGLDEEKISVNDFDLLKIVGKGAFGKVMLVRKKVGQGAGQIYAMKVLKKSVVAAKGQIENTLSEREILCEMRHPFIVRLRFAFQSEDKLYLVTDYYNGGTLFYHLRKSRQFSEERARFYAAELLLALDHLHSHDIIYRDLKLENVLLDHMGHVALTDFGLSKQNIDKTGGATTFCGTVSASVLFNRFKSLYFINF